MIEVTILSFLLDQLSAPVSLEVPVNKPDEFVVFEKTGSGERNHIVSATIAIQSCSTKSLYRAANLNDQVKKAMKNIVGLNQISRCKLNTDYNFTDRESKTYRYQAIFDLVYYD